MRVNVSAVKTFLADEMDWYYAYHLGRVPRRTPLALSLGTLWHSLQEHLARGESKEHAKLKSQDGIAATVNQLLADDATDDLAEYEKGVEHMFSLFDAYRERVSPDETLLIEQPIEMPMTRHGEPVHTLFGRPDRVIRHEGRLWHVQNRTLSDRTPIPVYLAAAERDLHELAYASLICYKYQQPVTDYGGTLLNIVRKVSRKRLAESPDEAFVQEFIPLQPVQIYQAFEDIAAVADRMEAIVALRAKPIQNRDTDKGRFGNRLSDYFNVKLGRMSIADNTHFKDAESRYDAEVAAE